MKKQLIDLQKERGVYYVDSDDLSQFDLPFDECRTPGLLELLKSARARHGKMGTKVLHLKEEIIELEGSMNELSNIIHRLKAELSTREHVPNKAERKVIRQKKAVS